MVFDKLIEKRHSIRDYQNKDIDYKIIGEILDIVKNAPSSGNIQNWIFIIVKDKEKREKMAKSCLNQTWMNQAPVNIVVCYDERNIKTLYPENYKELSIQNVSIISTLIMLKATELNLGTCWISVTNQFEISNLLKLPDYIVPSVIITLGYSKNTYKKTTRNSINTMLYFEGYNKKQANISIYPLSKYVKKLSSQIKTKLKR